MDPMTVGGVAASLLAGAFAQGIGGELGKGAVTSLVNLVRSRFAAADVPAHELSLLEEQPQDEAHIEAVGKLIDREAADEEFARQLKSLIGAACRDPAVNSFVTNVQAGGQVNKIVNIGQVDTANF